MTEDKELLNKTTTSNACGVVKKAFNCADQVTPTWLQRAEICVELLSAIVSGHGAQLLIADIGCGDQKLHEALRGCGFQFKYSGYDVLPQSDEVKHFDVRSDALSCHYDVAVMLGVIEYLERLPNVLGRMATQVPHLIVSHVIRQTDTYSQSRLSELGWINHLSAAELESLLVDCGFIVSTRRMTPDGRTLLLGCKSDRSGSAT